MCCMCKWFMGLLKVCYHWNHFFSFVTAESPILFLVFAVLKPWVPLKSMFLSVGGRGNDIEKPVCTSLFNIFGSLSRTLHDCWMFNSHIFTGEKSLYVGLMLVPFKSEGRNKPICAFENSFFFITRFTCCQWMY